MENLGLFDLTHSIQVGIRAAIIVPTCELALQVLKVMKVVVVPIEKEAVLSVLIGIVVDTVQTKPKPSQQLAAHQTIVFLATKHHLKYIGGLLIGSR
ncbi:hypothetical protein PSHT_07651 [Puccinia striiformis]|uniref:Uncharacterized protein n=2 Tax=Puccinia striiformis TaxID=27350 RepID=A0A2S4VW42_9BASI|nr:hypothetical protein PSTT_07458 [Puccinia striiformis]POW13726.1 hypothetical protein PSHT_07651 [Puccinia striiformis]